MGRKEQGSFERDMVKEMTAEQVTRLSQAFKLGAKVDTHGSLFLDTPHNPSVVEEMFEEDGFVSARHEKAKIKMFHPLRIQTKDGGNWYG